MNVCMCVCVHVRITVKQCVIETITLLIFLAQAHPWQERSRKLKRTNTKEKKRGLRAACVFNCVPACAPASVCMFMGVLVAAHGGWANLAWFSTVCCYSRLHIHWIGDECALRALQTAAMPRLSMRKTDRQTDWQEKTKRRVSFYWEVLS